MNKLFIALLLIFSGLAQGQSCEEMTKDFFLKETDAMLGDKAPSVKDRPKYVAKILGLITSLYPNVDATECLSKGLDAAQKTKRLELAKLKSQV